MLLTTLEDIQPGMQIGAPVLNPAAPGVILLKPGVTITGSIIDRLRRLGVTQVWVDHHLTRDLDVAVSPSLSQARMKVYNHLKNDLQKIARKTVSTAQLRTYRQSVSDLVLEAVANRDFVNLTDLIFDESEALVSHAANVAYLSIVIGLELEGYLVRERTRLPAWRARNVVNLGLGGLLHDIGKIQLDEGFRTRHEVIDADNHPDEYYDHPSLGYRMLPPLVSSVTRNAVLCHHLRFDGTGWSDLAGARGNDGGKAHGGRRIHIFSRIVTAANIIDNLLQDAEGNARPPVAALHDFASPRFDGWFDPVVRLAVLRCVPPFAIGTQVTLTDTRKAVVIQPNLRHPCRPIVRLLDSPKKPEAGNPANVDLFENRQLRITHAAGTPVEQWLFDVDERVLALGIRRDSLPDVA